MQFILDTNIVLIYTRGSNLTKKIDKKYDLLNLHNELYISIVTVAELKSIMLQRNYGAKKIRMLEKIVSSFSIIDINIEEILNKYAEIDAYSQGKLSGLESDFSARNMGKNDLYIAATSSVYNLKLVTTDNDFDHLSPNFLELEKINIRDFKKK